MHRADEQPANSERRRGWDERQHALDAFRVERDRACAREQLLCQVGRTLVSQTDLDAALGEALRAVCTHLGAAHAAVVLVDDEGLVERVLSPAGDVLAGQAIGDAALVAHAIAQREGMLIEDAAVDERWRHLADGAAGPRAVAAVPLWRGDRLHGACLVASPTPGAFDRQDLALLLEVADPIALAVDAARSVRLAARRSRDLALISEISHDIGTQLDIDQLMWEIVRLIRETFDCYYVTIGLIEGQELVFRSGITYLYQTIPEVRLPLGRDEPSIAGWVVEHGRSCVVRDVRDDPRYMARYELEDIRSQLGVPLKVLDRTRTVGAGVDEMIGVLDVASTQVGAFSEEDQYLLEALAAQVSVAIENARLFSRIQDEQATLAALINGTDDAIVITDPADRILVFNPAAQGAFRHDAAPAPGTPLAEAIDNQALWAFWQCAAENVMHSTELQLADGRTLHASITTVPDVGKVAVMQDITYLKELDEIKSEFVSTVSHDLRSPLQVIQSSAELLPRLGPLNQEQQREVEYILAVVRRISELVRDLLDIARIEAGVGMDVEPCALDEIVAKAAGSCRPLAEEQGLALVVDLPRALPLVRGNRLRLDQVVTNLLNNAIKFTPDGEVRISARFGEACVIMEVQDTGVGISPEAQEMLFEKFYRVQNPDTRGIQGTGLGLAIVKSIVESYGGSIRVESFPRLGSTFVVHLPLWEEGATVR
ncbi:MAG: GAF domain-containing protein [Anaerolineae bacterium]|nr:GAF domain-containing protein [Anaerolineae bacterium]